MKITIPKCISSQPPKIIISIVVFCFLLFATILASLFPPRTLSSVDQFRVEWINTFSIEPNTIATQSFEATDDFSGFGLLFADSEQAFDQGRVKIEVYNRQELIDTCYVETKNFVRSSFFYCETPIVSGWQYELVISSEDTVLPITFLTTSTYIEGASLSLAQKTQDRLVVMDFLKQRSNYMLAWLFAVLANLVACYITANIGKELHGPKRG